MLIYKKKFVYSTYVFYRKIRMYNAYVFYCKMLRNAQYIIITLKNINYY